MGYRGCIYIRAELWLLYYVYVSVFSWGYRDAYQTAIWDIWWTDLVNNI